MSLQHLLSKTHYQANYSVVTRSLVYILRMGLLPLRAFTIEAARARAHNTWRSLPLYPLEQNVKVPDDNAKRINHRVYVERDDADKCVGRSRCRRCYILLTDAHVTRS